MARQRKQKQRESRAPTADANRPLGNSCCSVRHQKLCVVIDVPSQRIYGHTELKILSPKSGVIGLHARGLHIEQVLVDGVSVHFELQQLPYQKHQPESAPTSPPLVKDAADIGFSKYLAALDDELVPELLIYAPTEFSQVAESQDIDGQANGKDQVVQDSKSEIVSTPIVAPAEKFKLLRIQYWVEKPLAGAHFTGNALHTNSQLRRTRCWFPCVDTTLERCSYTLEFTVASEYIAVSNGKLLHQVYSADGPHLKTYVYSVNIPTTASLISLVVAPLVVLPDRQNAMISHMCMPDDVTKLQCSVSFFYSVYSTYEEYLGAPFPFGCYKQVFIDSESSVSTTSIGASMVTISSNLLVDDWIIDQAFDTQIKLAFALAQQWFGVFISADCPSDAWLLEGLAGFLCDQYIKRYLGNNEACYRRCKANEAVCMVDLEGTPILGVSGPDLYGTERLGVLGQIRAWKATSVVHMLEKQMGPEPFRKILQRIILRAQDPVRHLRTLSTKEFRHFANKVGNLERPFLKEFFPRWVESSGCPRLRMGFAYSKRRNMVELAVRRESTASSDAKSSDKPSVGKGTALDPGWPGMMSIRVHELDGVYDHPSLPMAGDTYQILELQCHSKLAGRRITKPKKGAKSDTADDNTDGAAALDMRVSMESPLLWLRADPQMEYLAEISLHQPEQMWINQLEKDRDVVGQLQAITAMCSLSRPSFAVVAALNNCLTDTKVFCRVRIEAALALASTATEATGWAGLSNLIRYYKSCRFDPDIGLPRSNDFRDTAEYFVLEAIPGAVACIRGSDGRSPPEATDFILHVLKHNDNSGNLFSDVYWLASVIESIGSLEFGPENMQIMSKFLKQIDRFLQYDRLMPSYNYILTISCIHTLTRIAIKFSNHFTPARLEQLLYPFIEAKGTRRQVRLAALQSLLEIEAQCKGVDASVSMGLHLIKMEQSLAVQSKLMEYITQMCSKDQQSAAISSANLAELLHQLDGELSIHNILLRHHTFALLQILADRPASLFRKDESQAIQVMQQPLTPQVAPQQITPQETIPVKEAKVKSAPPLKVKLQQPQLQPQPRPEPLRIRVVPVRPTVPPKEEPLTVNVNSIEKVPVKEHQKVGKVKLRLKVTSHEDTPGVSPIELSSDRVVVAEVTPARSPVSIPVTAKPEQAHEETPKKDHVRKRDSLASSKQKKSDQKGRSKRRIEAEHQHTDTHVHQSNH